MGTLSKMDNTGTSSFADGDETLVESATLVGGVEEDDCALEDAASAVTLLRVESGESQRVAVSSMEETSVAAMLCKASIYHTMQWLSQDA